MAQILVRNVSPETLERLKAQGREHGRSLQSEVQLILEEAAGPRMEKARKLADRLRTRLAGRLHSDSTEFLAEDRAR